MAKHTIPSALFDASAANAVPFPTPSPPSSAPPSPSPRVTTNIETAAAAAKDHGWVQGIGIAPGVCEWHNEKEEA